MSLVSIYLVHSLFLRLISAPMRILYGPALDGGDTIASQDPVTEKKTEVSHQSLRLK